jgi:HSP20 family protein
MKIKPWDPFRDLDDLIGDYLPLDRRGLSRLLRGTGQVAEWRPAADLSETESEYVIRADLPGVKKDDVAITLSEGTLTLAGERKEEKKAKNENEIRVERFVGSFTRRFSLPDDADATAIKAEAENGALTIHIPKKKGAKPAEIRIPVQ